MRILKNRLFACFADSNKITDIAFREAIRRAEHGLIDADLGGGVIKQRVARPGKGRSGGFRTMLHNTAEEIEKLIRIGELIEVNDEEKSV